MSVWDSGSFAVTGAVSETVRLVCVRDSVLGRQWSIVCVYVIHDAEKGKPKRDRTSETNTSFSFPLTNGPVLLFHLCKDLLIMFTHTHKLQHYK